MKFHQIPHTDLNVSRICLGTMTWGEQNTEQEAHQQLDYAIDRGINFIDAAEMYPVPPKPETQGLTEEYIGSWLASRKNREDIILATKIAGPAEMTAHIRGGTTLDAKNISAAIDSSLQRLQTDYIDLYQLHWPARPTNFFGQLNYQYNDVSSGPELEESLYALGELVKSGKIRYVGLSNETAWGTMHCLKLADQLGVPRVATIQNPYSLLNRSFETGLAEVSHREGVELLAYSPLAFGALSGKYLNNQWPEGARMTLFKRFARYFNESGIAATEAYVALAKAHNISPATLALAFVNQQPFVASNIIGATSIEQLKENIDSINVTLNDDIKASIEEISSLHTNPCP